MIQAVLNHLWQSTLVVIVVGVWAWALREHRAALRYWLWFSAAAKFLVPFSLLVVLGSYFAPRVSFTATVAPVLSRIVAPVPRELEIVPLSASAPVAAGAAFGPSKAPYARGAQLLLGLWASGAGLVLGRWVLRWWRLRQTVEESVPLSIAAPIPVRAAPTAMEPGVVGVVRPVLVLPHAIEEHLNAEELRAVLLHELEHVRRGDNLTAGICMLMQALFWFYPLVWWLGRRLMVEREIACDQAVIAAGCDPETYAQGILNVCKLYVESPRHPTRRLPRSRSHESSLTAIGWLIPLGSLVITAIALGAHASSASFPSNQRDRKPSCRSSPLRSMIQSKVSGTCCPPKPKRRRCRRIELHRTFLARRSHLPASSRTGATS